MDDLISRQAAIEKVEMLFKTLSKEYVDMMGIGYNHAVSDNIAILKNLPAAEPKWIPVTERLPDKMGTYLVTLDYKEYGTGVMTGVMSLWFHNEEIGWDSRVADEVTAWMPLPEPWKGEEDG